MCYRGRMKRPLRDGTSDAARAQLRSLYAETDELLAPYSCDSSTECCQFGVTGREPYPTAIELAEIERAIRAAPLPAPPLSRSSRSSRRALPVLADSRRCPLLSEEGRCRIYTSRPFGCRTYFCARMQGPRKLPRDEIQRLSREIAALSARFAPRDPHPRPLTRALAALGLRT